MSTPSKSVKVFGTANAAIPYMDNKVRNATTSTPDNILLLVVSAITFIIVPYFIDCFDVNQFINIIFYLIRSL